MKRVNHKIHWLKKTLGPGILFASTAIGVSHLVQSTRAGAKYGFGLLIFIIIANLFKYPFFEFASRYSNVKKVSIIEGYKTLSIWILWSYLIITILSMFFITSAVGAVTAGFLQNLFNTENLKIYNHIILFSICGSILIFGQYKSLLVYESPFLLSYAYANTLSKFSSKVPNNISYYFIYYYIL